jgi:hypothetical protein
LIVHFRMLRRITADDVVNTSTSVLSFGSMSSSFYEPDWEDHRDRLKKSFEGINFRDALLIIDDLKDKKVIDAFNVGCKILITSQDSKLTEGYSPSVLNVSNQFIDLRNFIKYATSFKGTRFSNRTRIFTIDFKECRSTDR